METIKKSSQTEVSETEKSSADTKKTQTSAGKKRGMIVDRYFSQPTASPFNELEWETRDASIVDGKGEVVFEQKEVEVPKEWSQMATNVVSSKYFCTKIESKKK